MLHHVQITFKNKTLENYDIYLKRETFWLQSTRTNKIGTQKKTNFTSVPLDSRLTHVVYGVHCQHEISLTRSCSETDDLKCKM